MRQKYVSNLEIGWKMHDRQKLVHFLIAIYININSSPSLQRRAILYAFGLTLVDAKLRGHFEAPFRRSNFAEFDVVELIVLHICGIDLQKKSTVYRNE